VISALRRLTNTSERHTTVNIVATTVYPQEPDEEVDDYLRRIRVAETDIRRAIRKRGNTSGVPMGPLSDLVKVTSEGPAYNPYRMFLPDHLRAGS